MPIAFGKLTHDMGGYRDGALNEIIDGHNDIVYGNTFYLADARGDIDGKRMLAGAVYGVKADGRLDYIGLTPLEPGKVVERGLDEYGDGGKYLVDIADKGQISGVKVGFAAGLKGDGDILYPKGTAWILTHQHIAPERDGDDERDKRIEELVYPWTLIPYGPVCSALTAALILGAGGVFCRIRLLKQLIYFHRLYSTSWSGMRRAFPPAERRRCFQEAPSAQCDPHSARAFRSRHRI